MVKVCTSVFLNVFFELIEDEDDWYDDVGDVDEISKYFPKKLMLLIPVASLLIIQY